MSNNYYIRKVLNKSEIDEIKRLIEIANDNNFWSSGLYSGGGKSSIKSNLEISNPEILSKINDYIMRSLDSDKKFFAFTSPESSPINIVSKTESGNYYNPHIDSWNNGDFSTTVFLNSPDEYDGGELCLLLGNDEEKKVKLEPGWAITYPTGIVHRVNKVISGTRYVSVFWTRSIIKDQNIRTISYYVQSLIEILEENPLPIHYSNCSSALKDPLFIARNLQNELYRLYSR